MRPLVLILLLLASGGVLRAQEQERKLIDRILKPDYSLGNSMQDKTFNSGGGGGLDTTKSANVKDFYFVQKFSAKTYQTKEYAARGFWQGDFQFATKAAAVKTDNAANKVFETKAAAVKDAHEAGKDYANAARGYATREADEKGKTSQNHLDSEYLPKGQMNMDQVRDLLNKNH